MNTPQETGESRPHAKHSPSSLAYKEICPGFKNREESSPAADEGTLLHKALETGKTEGFDDEQLQVVEMCRDYIENLEATAKSTGPVKILREIQFNIADGLTFGTTDYLLVATGTCSADLVDFKFGRNTVPDSEINPQVQAYVLGAFEKFPDIDSIRAHVLLPRRDEVFVGDYARADVGRLRLRISTIISRCEHPEPELFPTDNCLWCSRQATCVALHKHALTVANGYEGELQIPDQLRPGQILDPTMMSRALSVARVLEKWCDSVKHHALQMRLGGHEIPGHELRTRAGIRKITDSLAAWAAVRDRMTPDQFIGCTDVSISKLENTFAEAAPRGGKTKAKQEFSEALADLGIVESSKESFYLAKTKH